MFLEIRKVGNVGCNFGEVPNRSGTIRSQKVRFNKDAFLLDPRKKVVGGASMFDAAKGAVAAEVAADANVRFVLIFDASCQYGAEFLEFLFSSHSGADSRIT